MTIFSRYKKRAERVIQSAGTDCNVLRESQTGTDRYGKPVIEWVSVGTVRAVVFYGSRRAIVTASDAGRFRLDTPRFMFTLDADLAEGDRVEVFGRAFRVDAITSFPTHREATSTVVTNG